MGLIKPFFLGFVIVTIGCHVGLRTTGGTQGVGRATTNAVVAASVAVIAVDFFVTQAADYAAVLMATVDDLGTATLRRPACAGAAGRRRSTTCRWRSTTRSICRTSASRCSRAHEDHPRRQRLGQVDDPEAHPRPAASRTAARSG